ncbi:MAG: NUDIX hydrolase [Cyclobacteriaceae bacterium]|nr:NUDIX hydrolase [Cyclobacteriaceae bacterium HetDA_MAG_MS6]
MTDISYPTKDIRLAVDCIIFGFSGSELSLLLIHRGFEPEKGLWSLMGGFVKDDEHLDESPRRVLKSLTGLDDIYLEQVHAFGDVGRDPGGRVVSLTYFALIRKETEDEVLLDEHDARWFPITDLPELIFDHQEMVKSALKQLILKTRIQPIGFNLLPEKFTLPELQSLYEAIYGRRLDDRNFRRRILSLGILEKLEEKEKSNSKKGAYLFRFDKTAYDALREDAAKMNVFLTLF